MRHRGPDAQVQQAHLHEERSGQAEGAHCCGRACGCVALAWCSGGPRESHMPIPSRPAHERAPEQFYACNSGPAKWVPQSGPHTGVRWQAGWGNSGQQGRQAGVCGAHQHRTTGSCWVPQRTSTLLAATMMWGAAEASHWPAPPRRPSAPRARVPPAQMPAAPKRCSCPRLPCLCQGCAEGCGAAGRNAEHRVRHLDGRERWALAAKPIGHLGAPGKAAESGGGAAAGPKAT